MAKAFDTLIRDIQGKLQAVFLKKSSYNLGRVAMSEATNIPWSWVAVNVAKVLSEFPTGLTKTVLLSILELMWEKTFLKRFKGFERDFSTIQAVYDSSSAETLLLEVIVKNWSPIQGVDNYQITATDELKIREIDIYMHPKYNPWITYAHAEFFKDRRIRMICPPKANSPIINKYNNLTFPRRYRVALIPPTELLLIMLNKNDKEFVLREFPDRVRDIDRLSAQEKKCRLWLKIIHVEVTIHANPTSGLGSEDGSSKSKRTDIFLMDMSSDSSPVILSLYDQQTRLASIFRRNDYIGLHQPTILMSEESDKEMPVPDTNFEYNHDTVIFLMPEKEAQISGLAKVNLTSAIESVTSEDIHDPKKDILQRDEEGFIDCSVYQSRIYVKDLVHCMLHVTLLGRIVALADNNPYVNGQKSEKRMDRYALRIEDSTGIMDITLWEDTGRETRKLKVGQYILLDNLVTSNRHESLNKKVWYVNGSVICGTKFYNISTLNCLLSSASFRSISPLWHARETKEKSFQVEGIISGWELYLKSSKVHFVLSDEYNRSRNTASKQDVDFLDFSLGDRITTKAHAGCFLPLNFKTKENCTFCGCRVGNDIVHIFRPRPTVAEISSAYTYERDWEGWIEWKFDDGTSTCNIYGDDETLLNITAHHFNLMSHQSQVNLLDSVIGLPIVCLLSSVGNDTLTYRMDQMTLLEPTQQECRDMVQVIAKK